MRAISQTGHNYTYDSMFRMVHLGRSLLSFSISPYIVNKARAQPIAGNFCLSGGINTFFVRRNSSVRKPTNAMQIFICCNQITFFVSAGNVIKLSSSCVRLRRSRIFIVYHSLYTCDHEVVELLNLMTLPAGTDNNPRSNTL